MKISNFEEFIFESETDMPFYMSDMLVSVMQKIDNPIAKAYLQMHDDMKMTAITMLDTNLDGSDKITFIKSSFLRATVYSTYDDEDALKKRIKVAPLDPTGNIWKRGRNPLRIGSLTRTFFPQYDDIQREKFVSEFKAKNRLEPGTFEIVSGNDIGHCYQTYMYTSEYGYSNPLWKSCMTDKDYFDIYIRNPEVCKMVVLKVEEIDTDTGEVKDRISGRALLWETDSGTLLDRIYYCREEDYYKFIEWGKKNADILKMENKNGRTDFLYKGKVVPCFNIKVKLKDSIKNYSPYPYIDTMSYGHDENGKGILTNYLPKVDTMCYKFTDDENGGFHNLYN